MEENLRLYTRYQMCRNLLFWLPVFFLYFSSRLALDEVLALDIGRKGGLDHLHALERDHDGRLRVAEVDLGRDASALRELTLERFDAIFHLAAIVGVRYVCDHPYETMAVNMRATLDVDGDGALVATPFDAQDSAMMAGLARADCLVVRPPHAPPAKAGERVEIIRLREGMISV